MSTDIEKYYQKLQADIAQALAECNKPDVQSELGARIESFKRDLQDLQNMSLSGICNVSMDQYAYFRGPNPHDDVYVKSKTLLHLSLSILSQIAGIIYANGS